MLVVPTMLIEYATSHSPPHGPACVTPTRYQVQARMTGFKIRDLVAQNYTESIQDYSSYKTLSFRVRTESAVFACAVNRGRMFWVRWIPPVRYTS